MYNIYNIKYKIYNYIYIIIYIYLPDVYHKPYSYPHLPKGVHGLQVKLQAGPGLRTDFWKGKGLNMV
jgi:hypothetical protein